MAHHTALKFLLNAATDLTTHERTNERTNERTTKGKKGGRTSRRQMRPTQNGRRMNPPQTRTKKTQKPNTGLRARPTHAKAKSSERNKRNKSNETKRNESNQARLWLRVGVSWSGTHFGVRSARSFALHGKGKGIGKNLHGNLSKG